MKELMKRSGIMFTAIVFILGLLSSVALAETKQEIIEKAKKEGALTLYWTIAGDVANNILADFNKEYPFIKINRVQVSSFQMVARYYQEVMARRATADMITVTDLLPFLQFYKEGNLLQYESPEWKNLVNLPKDFYKPGYWAPYRLSPIAIMVNTNIVDPSTVKSYDDILQDRFKNKIAAGDVEHSDNAYPFYYALRKASNSTHYWKRLGELKAQVFTSSEKSSEACVAGEWPVIFDQWTFREYQYGVLKGAPVKSIIPKEGAVVIPGISGIMKQGSHPNASKLMQDFLFTREVQKMMSDVIGYHSAIKGVPVAKGQQAWNDIKVIPLDYDDAEVNRKAWMAEWKKLMNR
jgi:iron(III) transport system substrate-binding protein